MDKRLEDGVKAKIWENEVQEGQLVITEWEKQVTMTKKGAMELKGMLDTYFDGEIESDE